MEVLYILKKQILLTGAIGSVALLAACGSDVSSVEDVHKQSVEAMKDVESVTLSGVAKAQSDILSFNVDYSGEFEGISPQNTMDDLESHFTYSFMGQNFEAYIDEGMVYSSNPTGGWMKTSLYESEEYAEYKGLTFEEIDAKIKDEAVADSGTDEGEVVLDKLKEKLSFENSDNVYIVSFSADKAFLKEVVLENMVANAIEGNELEGMLGDEDKIEIDANLAYDKESFLYNEGHAEISLESSSEDAAMNLGAVDFTLDVEFTDYNNTDVQVPTEVVENAVEQMSQMETYPATITTGEGVMMNSDTGEGSVEVSIKMGDDTETSSEQGTLPFSSEME